MWSCKREVGEEWLFALRIAALREVMKEVLGIVVCRVEALVVFVCRVGYTFACFREAYAILS